ncbi:sensor histidine kinase [Amycolatopsis sp. H20-H5]|uniref:sensor histidine kinase n=1 Tax=Amycolatopsis sp. H20-H5 TaxID=3046309 RepID=UPI002DBF61B4|nr:HAMP domain-containing sensor histidine kinase [Amycolatopsis sp. H20-H5]MEC3982697.1 HAMP domain-containing sensor histidine kinase [Amycolatopsis sp. H20-H5]
MRRSLLIRLLAVSVLVAVCSIAATAWLAARTATGAIEQEQGRALADDNRIYTTLLDYAATHPNWSEAGPVVANLARQTGRRVALLTQDRRPIADSVAKPDPLPSTASAVVDPLAVDPALVADSGVDRVAPAALGPFRLPAGELTELRGRGQKVLACVRGRTGSGTLTEAPNGHPRIESPYQLTGVGCGVSFLSDPTPTEETALTALAKLVDDCLSRRGIGPVKLNLDRTWISAPAKGADSSGLVVQDTQQTIQACVTTSRHEQLASFVSPSALLFVTSTGGAPPTTFDLSAGNRIRIAGVAAAVLALTIVVTVLAGTRLVRPLRALTGAAQRMKEGDAFARVDVKGKDELARLAVAFNEMSAARERLEEQRKAMVSDIAHELRTPLSNIRGWLEATEDGVSEPGPALVSSLLEEALQLEHIVDDLQDLSMADAGKLRLHPEPVWLVDLLAQVEVAHGGRAREAGVTLSVRADDVELRADPVRLRQAVDNLVTNAVRHTPEGGTVTVRGRRDDGEVVIEVTDTGEGIAADELPQVFDRFWRADKSRSRPAGGSGLGLAIVKKLMEAHDGTVTAASTAGEGSTFTLRLPPAD